VLSTVGAMLSSSTKNMAFFHRIVGKIEVIARDASRLTGGLRVLSDRNAKGS
jgi:hypothetical protein